MTNRIKNIDKASERSLGKIIQITSTMAHNKEIDRDMALVYALTDTGRVFEYLVGAWVELNPLEQGFLAEFNKEGQLIPRGKGAEHGDSALVAGNGR